MTEATTRTPAGRYLILAVLTVSALIIQVRLSLATVETQRTLNYYVPFLLEPFTSRVHALGHSMNWEKGRQADARRLNYSVLRLGDRVVKVNGRPFTGLSSYLTQLWNTQHRTEPRGQPPSLFFVTVVTREGSTREIEFGFPHCTCGIPELFEAVFFWTVAPLFCITIGALTAALRPNSVLAWTFLGLMLSLSQLQFWNEPYPGFQLTTNPMIWSDFLRVPAVVYRSFVQHLWPATLAIAAIHVGRRDRRMHPLQGALIAVLLAFAVAKASVAVAWSEGSQSMSFVHFLFEQHGTEALALSFILVTAAAWNDNRRIGTLAGLITTCAIVALFTGPAPITDGEWISYSDQTRRFDLVIPVFHRTPGMILGASVTAFLLASLVLFRRRLSWQPAVAVALCLPLATHVCASLGDWWYPFGGPSFESWRWIVALTAGSGIGLASLWVVKA
jgi:hypothetical protein